VKQNVWPGNKYVEVLTARLGGCELATNTSRIQVVHELRYERQQRVL